MHAVLERGVFCGQSKGIPAHWMQHVVSSQPFVAGYDIADGIVADMSHVNAARRIREHLQHIIFGPQRICADFVGLFGQPELLPLGFNALEIVFEGFLAGVHVRLPDSGEKNSVDRHQHTMRRFFCTAKNAGTLHPPAAFFAAAFAPALTQPLRRNAQGKGKSLKEAEVITIFRAAVSDLLTFLSCSLAKESGLAKKEFCRAEKKFCSARKKSCRLRKKFC